MSDDEIPIDDGAADDSAADDGAAGESGRRFPRWLKWGLFGALAILVVGYGLIFLYAYVINDSPDELGEADLDAALAADTTTPDAVDDTPATTAPPATAPATTGDEEGAADTTEPADGDDPDTTTPATVPPTEPGATTPDPAEVGPGEWVVTDASELGYRVDEVLFGVDTAAVGRTNQITGSMTIDDTTVTAAEFVVDVASITSDESRRDNQFRGRIMSTDEFPEATFVLTEPIELGTEVAEGATVETTATGELTLRGETNEVTFDLNGRVENGRIGVLGNIPVEFDDYGISNPSVGGITTEDHGLLEFVLVFEPA